MVRDVPQVDVHVHDQEGGGAGGGLLYKLSQVHGKLGVSPESWYKKRWFVTIGCH